MLLWGDGGYELRENRFQKTFEIAGEREFAATSVSAGSDGFFTICARQLVELHRGQKPIVLAPRLKNVMAVGPGPDGALLLKQGGNELGDLGKIYFPRDHTMIRLEPSLFDAEDPEKILELHYVDGALVAPTRHHLWSIPMTSVLSLPRMDAGAPVEVRVAPKAAVAEPVAERTQPKRSWWRFW